MLNSYKIYRFLSGLLCGLILLWLTGCAGVKLRTARFEKTSFVQIPGWQDDHHAWAIIAFKNSCDKILAINAEKAISNLTKIGGSAIDWQAPCLEAKHIQNFTDEEARLFFERWFAPYRTYNEEQKLKGLLTGYYQIELNGSRKRDKKYRYPIYLRPPELNQIKGSGLIEHAAINNGALSGRGLEIAWVDNRARLYFMHIQGSGVIKLREGGELHLGFDGHNGYAFKGIHKALNEKNLKLSSANEMMDWLHKHPVECRKIIDQDPSYVFFRKQQTKYAIGGQGVPLRPERSLAIDAGLYPYGAPIWVESQLSSNKLYKTRPYNRLFIAQDTGGAIKGAIRGDVFFGRGDKAEKVAGSFKTQARFYILFPKTVEVPELYSAN